MKLAHSFCKKKGKAVSCSRQHAWGILQGAEHDWTDFFSVSFSGHQKGLLFYCLLIFLYELKTLKFLVFQEMKVAK